MRKLLTILIVVFAFGLGARADQLADGDKELNFTFSHQDFSVDGGGDITNTDLNGRFGYLLTAHHEVGGILAYSNTEVGAVSTDSTGIGAFYQYNFTAGTNMNPFLDVHYLAIGGDQGDVTDSQYGLGGGIKIYPWDNGGFNFGVSWDQLTGASTFPDADGFSVFAGVLVKWGN